MIKVIKVIVVSTSLTVALTANTFSGIAANNEKLQLDNVYACQWWPTCRDPDQQRPVSTDSSVPKPSGDKDTTKDNKDEVQLA